MLPQRLPLDQMAVKWATELDPIIRNQLIRGILVPVKLINGVTVINHLLGRKQVGFIITDIDGAAIIYRSKPLNDLTLTITSNAAVNAVFWMF